MTVGPLIMLKYVGYKFTQRESRGDDISHRSMLEGIPLLRGRISRITVLHMKDSEGYDILFCVNKSRSGFQEGYESSRRHRAAASPSISISRAMPKACLQGEMRATTTEPLGKDGKAHLEISSRT